MRILNYGSLNIDHVYHVDHLVRAGETISARDCTVGCGGKGLNQSVALAMAGAEVYHAGLVGRDGALLRKQLEDSGVDCRFLGSTDQPNGCAIIQVDPAGENAIVLFPGSNRALTRPYIDKVLSHFGSGDILLLQNEVNELPYLIQRAADRAMDVALNAAPVDAALADCPLDRVRWLIVNQVEAAALSGSRNPEECARILCRRWPQLELVLTLGEDGVYYRKGDFTLYIPAHRVRAVDSTGAGDTFIGYFLAAMADGADLGYALTLATTAAALTVSRPGAADAIPSLEEVLKTL
jgi:ribokinase